MMAEDKSFAARGASIGASLLVHAALISLLLVHLLAQPPEELRVGKPLQIDLQPPLAPTPMPTPQYRSHPTARPRLTPSPLPTPTTPAAPAPLSQPALPAAPSVATGTLDEPIPWPLLVEVSRMIRVNNKYPPAARSLHQQGTVVLHMHMARDGRVLDASILKSTGFPLLDEAARNLVLHMHSFPPLPDAYLPGRDDYAIDQPVSYQL